jgi:hypothetical protein
MVDSVYRRSCHCRKRGALVIRLTNKTRYEDTILKIAQPAKLAVHKQDTMDDIVFVAWPSLVLLKPRDTFSKVRAILRKLVAIFTLSQVLSHLRSGGRMDNSLC